MAITTRADFKEYCLRKLGHPVLEINVDDDQVEDRIDDALQFFYEFHVDGTEKIYYKHQVTDGDKANGYISIPENTIGVSRIFPINENVRSTNNMFDIRYQMRLNDLWDLSSSQMSYYTMTMTHLEMIGQILNGAADVRFNQHVGKLYIDWDWENDVTTGEYLIAETFRKTDTDTSPNIWDDRILKAYATALIKRQWGTNLSKFAGIQLPGGVTLDGPTMFTNAETEIEKIEEDIRLMYEAPPRFMVG